MVVSGSLPNWDEAHRYVNQARDSQGNSTYNKLASYRLQPFHRDFGSARTKRAGYVGSIQDLMDIVGEALIDFQSYHMLTRKGTPGKSNSLMLSTQTREIRSRTSLQVRCTRSGTILINPRRS